MTEQAAPPPSIGSTIVIVLIFASVVTYCTREDKPDGVHTEAAAISACKGYYIDKNVDIPAFGGATARKDGEHWFVSVKKGPSDFRRCRVRPDGSVYDTN